MRLFSKDKVIEIPEEFQCTTNEACKILNRSRTFLWLKVREGKITQYRNKYDGSRIYHLEDLLKYKREFIG